MTNKTPELLAPAGSLEKLKVSLLYGADAVYCGGQKFGLRAAADNLTYDELREGVEFAHQLDKKVYVVLNSFLHDSDLEQLPEFISFLEEIQIDAVIVSDPGVIKTVKENSQIDIHLSTQASCLNTHAAKIWKSWGVKRLILGREVSIEEAGAIKKSSGLEVELFIHGSMCMAYSGNCVISNYTQGRDSNRGGCAHSCRFEYSVDFKNWESVETRKAYFMSSKDLNGIALLEEFARHGIDSVKIEGRMKSSLYAGSVSKVYREALDYYKEKGHFYSEQMKDWEAEMNKFSHRAYTEASLVEKAGEDSIFDERQSALSQDYVSAAEVVEAIEGEHILLQVRKAFVPGDELELLPFRGPAVKLNSEKILDISNQEIEKTRPTTLVKVPYTKGAQELNIVRKKSYAANNLL